jgi:hypothetical protein
MDWDAAGVWARVRKDPFWFGYIGYMTREEFIEVLDEMEYSYEIQGDKIVVTGKGDVWLASLTSLPSGVVFRNGGHVWLESLTSLPPGVVFENGGSYGGSVFFESLINVGFISRWQGNIEGIDSNRLLNKVIELGLFDRR